MSVRVVVADDQTVVREGLATLLGALPEVEVVGVAANGESALALVAETRPDVVLMDLRMPVMDGLRATAAVRARHPHTQVVVLTTYAEEDEVLAALASGALGYLTKDADRQAIARALVAAAAGQSVLDDAARERLLAAASRPAASPDEPAGRREAPPDGLTERELDVLRLLADGLSNGEIARALVVSEATVKTHVNHIFAKTGSRDRAQAVGYAHRRGLVA